MPRERCGVPGLYELAAGDRVADLLDAAGGATPGGRPGSGQPGGPGRRRHAGHRALGGASRRPSLSAPTGGSERVRTRPSAPVNINLAGPEELETLPGVGPATAAAIIEYRDANGPFASVDELIDVPGIGEAKLAAVADLVTV